MPFDPRTIRVATLAIPMALLLPAPLGPSAAQASVVWTAADLTAEQAAQVDLAGRYLDRFETNFKLAQDSAGTGTPKGSKARLAKMRLDQATVNLAPAREALAGLPADDPAVQAMQARLDGLQAEADALANQIAGKNTPAPAPADTPADADTPAPPPTPAPPADDTVRLDYRQEEVFRAARFNLNEVEGNLAALDEMVARFEATEDKNTIDHREVASGIATLENAQRKWGFARDSLVKLPKNGRGVAEQNLRFSQYEARMSGHASKLRPLSQYMAQLINPASYPTMQADLERMRDFARMYSDGMGFAQSPEAAIAAMEVGDQMMTELQTYAQTYLPLMQQATDEGQRLEAVGNGLLSKYGEFMAEAEQQKTALPEGIRADMAEADQYANEAVAEQKPGFFNGGIPQRMEWAETKLSVYAAVDPENYPAMRAEVDAFKESLAQRAKSLEQLIINENEMPADRYAGDDRQRLNERAINKWRELEPDAEVLTVRIPREQWNRSVKWSYSNGTWYKTDTSKLQAQVIVKHDNELAVVRPVNLYLNHLNSDELTANNFDLIDDEVPPHRYLLRSKVK
ncbi:MAG: hypothetical protein AAF138_02895 [Planctomycetota bacterium]